MIRMILALGLMTAAATPTLAVAQPYDQDQGRYCDDRSGCSDRAPAAGDYSRDSDYSDQNSDRGYGDEDSGRGYRGGNHYTGRVGSHWVDADGRRCAWREVTFRDNDGYPAFKWVTDCRD